MPVHSRITSINAFATGKTPAVPIDANYVEDYFDVQTFTRPLTNNGAQKVTTYVDLSQPEDEGFIWHKTTNIIDDHKVVTKLSTGKQIVANGQTIGIGSEQVIFNNNPQLAAISNVTLTPGGGNGAAIDFVTHNDGYVVHSTDYAAQSVGNDDQLDLNLAVQFKKKKKFFDVQTWTGNGVYGHEIFHDLDCEPGFIMIKRLDANDDWFAYHKYSDPTQPERYWYYALMDGQARKNVTSDVYALKPNGTKSVLLTNTTANSAAGQYTNYNGAPYIGYFFADKGSGGFGDNGTEDAIACGVGVVRTDRFAADAFNECGFEPDLVLIKNRTESDHWTMVNTASGWFDGHYNNNVGGSAGYTPFFNTTNQGSQSSWIQITNEANGFWVERIVGSETTNGDEFIWVAIRKPQRTPIQENVQRSGIGGTCFFQAFKGSGINRTPREQPGFTPDMAWWRGNLFNGTVSAPWVQFRSFGNQNSPGIEDGQDYSVLYSNSWDSATSTPLGSDNRDIGIIEKGYVVNNDGSYVTDANTAMYVFRKARGFFDTIAWHYNNVGVHTVRHSLGVKPEFAVIKSIRGTTGEYTKWKIYHAGIGATMGASLGEGPTSPASAFAPQTWWNNTEPTATELFTGPGVSNGSPLTDQGFRGFMFSSIEGICKVGIYTGTNQDIEVNCGFSSAPRFLMIKNANTTDNFFVWDNNQGLSPSPVGTGEQMWGTPGNYTWTAPAGVTECSVVLVGGGGGACIGAGGLGGGGGALAYKNNITIVPGTTYNITVGVGGSHGVGASSPGTNGGDGGNSTFTVGSETYMAYGGGGAIKSPSNIPGIGGTCSANTDNAGIGTGGRGGWQSAGNAGGGGGGAGGYSGSGGGGGYQGSSQQDGSGDGADGQGGGAGGGEAGNGGNDEGGAGGGVGIYGEGASGAGGSGSSGDGNGGGGGSVSNLLTPPGPNNNVGGGRGGTGGSWSPGSTNDGYFGGGGGAQGGSTNSMNGAKGAVRIIWGKNTSGAARTFPDASTAGSLYDPYWFWDKDTAQQTSHDYVGVTSTGFGIAGGAVAGVNDNGSKFIYLAIA